MSSRTGHCRVSNWFQERQVPTSLFFTWTFPAGCLVVRPTRSINQQHLDSLDNVKKIDLFSWKRPSLRVIEWWDKKRKRCHLSTLSEIATVITKDAALFDSFKWLGYRLIWLARKRRRRCQNCRTRQTSARSGEGCQVYGNSNFFFLCPRLFDCFAAQQKDVKKDKRKKWK